MAVLTKKQKKIKELLEKIVDNTLTVKFTGTGEDIEEQVRKYEFEMSQYLGAFAMPEFYGSESKYTVKLFYENDPENAISGTGDTYQEAKQKAYEDFPFELTDKVQELVEAEVKTMFSDEFIGFYTSISNMPAQRFSDSTSSLKGNRRSKIKARIDTSLNFPY